MADNTQQGSTQQGGVQGGVPQGTGLNHNGGVQNNVVQNNTNSDELKKAQDEIKTLKEQIAKYAGSNNNQNNGNTQSQSYVERTEQQLKAEKEKNAQNMSMQEAIQFNMNIDNFIEKSTQYLPDNSKMMIENIKADSAKYGDAERQANVYRQNLLDNFFKYKDNCDITPEHLKYRLNEYKSLADKEREVKSKMYWDLLLSAVDRKALMLKSREASIANGKGYGFRNEVEDYNARFFKNSSQRVLGSNNNQN